MASVADGNRGQDTPSMSNVTPMSGSVRLNVKQFAKLSSDALT